MSNPAELHGITQIAISVQDVAASVVFYRDQLGLKLLFEAPPGLAFFDCGGVRLMLSPTSLDARGGSRPMLYYTVADVPAAAAELERRGVPKLEDPHVIARMGKTEVWLAAFSDPDGHLIGLMANRESD